MMAVKVDKKYFEESADISKKEKSILLLFNDDIHSFDYVIESLIEICEHSGEQAEQCAIIAHYKGFSEVKTGSGSVVKEMHIGLINKGLKARIK